jgi:ABC-type lipoprotein release transport system permease subunit
MNVITSLQRQLNVLDYALASLYRRRLKNTGIFIVFGTVIFLFSSFQLMTRGLTETAAEVLQDSPDITVQQMSAGRQTSLDLSVISSLQDLFGVTAIVPRIWGYYFDESNGANYTVVGLDLQKMQHDVLPPLATGNLPAGGTTGDVVLSESVRASLDLETRRSFSLFRPDLSLMSFTTSGIFDSATSLVTADMMLMSLADARTLFALPESTVTDLMVSVANPREIDTIAAKISERIPGSRVLTRNQIMKTYSVVFSWRSGFGGICLLTSLVAFVILAYDKASGLSKEDLKEVGILKILGWQTSDVMAIRFWESGVVAIFALIFGYSLAWLHVVWWHGVLFQPLLLGWSVLRPEIHVVPSFAVQDLLLIFSVSVLPYLCATVVPAWRSAMVRPDTVI